MASRYLSPLLLTLASLSAVTAAPVVAETVYPEVIPGPGLPSLASLNLTSAELYTMKPGAAIQSMAKRASLFEKRFDNECGPDDSAYTDVDDIIACYNYLNSLGTTGCSAPADEVVIQLCSAGSGQIIGQSITGGTSSSYCSDVALGVLWVINDCTRTDQSVAGFAAANGNGNLIIGAVNIDY